MRLLDICKHIIRATIFLALLVSGQVAWAQLAKVGNENIIDKNYRPSGSVVELRTAKAKNQVEAEECFLFAYISELETSHENSSYIGSTPAISVPYLLARKIEGFVNQSFVDEEPTTSLRGGQVYDAIALAHFYGIVPEVSWRPTVSYALWDTEELYNTINKNVRTWKNKLQKVAVAEGKNSAAYKKAVKEATEDSLTYLYDLTGELPTHINFEGKRYTPRQLSKRFGADRRKDIRMMYPPAKWAEEHLDFFASQLDIITDSTRGTYTITAGDWADTVFQIKTNLDAGKATLIATSWGRGGGHVLTIVGYEINEAGKITHLKALNSWGTDWGKAGKAWFEAKDLAKTYDQIWWFEF